MANCVSDTVNILTTTTLQDAYDNTVAANEFGIITVLNPPGPSYPLRVNGIEVQTNTQELGYLPLVPAANWQNPLVDANPPVGNRIVPNVYTIAGDSLNTVETLGAPVLTRTFPILSQPNTSGITNRAYSVNLVLTGVQLIAPFNTVKIEYDSTANPSVPLAALGTTQINSTIGGWINPISITAVAGNPLIINAVLDLTASVAPLVGARDFAWSWVAEITELQVS